MSGLRFDHDALPGRVLFGAGRVGEVPAELERLGARRALLIAGNAQSGTAERLGGGVVETIVGVRQHVPIEDAEQARSLAAEARADSLVALGGGSAIGLAKAVALTSKLPIVAVPTTYSGSEMTLIWGLTEGDRKTTGRDPAVLPRTVIYDPELTLSLPASIAAPSGMNALAHAVESLWVEAVTPLTGAVAEEAIRTLAPALRRIVAAPDDVGARERAVAGAWLAASALAVTGTGLHHRICHVLGGAFGLPHAELHAVVLPYVTAFNAPAAPDAIARVARALGADDAVDALVELSRSLGIPPGLGALGLPADGLELAADLVAEVAPARPRHATREDALRLLGRALAGDPPVRG